MQILLEILFYFCVIQKNVVPLQSNPTLEGNMSCEKCFVRFFLRVGF